MDRRNILDVPVAELLESEIIYDWNRLAAKPPPAQPIVFFDETLRDGIQSPSVVDPSVEEKLRIVHLMDDLGVQHADIGLPGAGARAFEHVREVAREIRDAKLAIRPACAARTLSSDIQPIVDISQELGIAIEVMAFVGSSAIRLYAEQWDLERLLSISTDALAFCRRYDLPSCYVTEDTSRAHPQILRPLLLNAVEHGAERLCLCDTVGHATPDGVRALVSWTRQLLAEAGEPLPLDWHGHDDRGLGLENALWATEFGVDRIHGTALGLGERVGNAPLDQMLLNMRLLGWIDNDLAKLVEYGETVAAAMKRPIPDDYPLLGRDAFRTGTGVHAAALAKARRRGDTYLADRVYSGVPAAMFGRDQTVEIGHMSGESNVRLWLEERGVDAEPELVERIFTRGKACNRLLSTDEVWEVIDSYRREKAGDG